MFSECFENVKTKHPLIHNITNYVTVNDCANILLACGASPIMADDSEEVSEITSVCSGLNINMGTPNSKKIESMLIAGIKSNELGHSVVLDPVGAGASSLRKKGTSRLLNTVKFSVIKGNITEIKALIKGNYSDSGVDADMRDKVTEENIDDVVRLAKAFSEKTGAVIVITGETDIVSDSQDAYCIRNGHHMMSYVTGTGCMLSALTTAYVSANPDNTLEAAASAVVLMGLAGEIAADRMKENDGNASFRNYLIDVVFKMTGEELEKGARYEMR